MDSERVDIEPELTEKIIGAAIDVHRALGPGLLESCYEMCLVYELIDRGCQVQRQVVKLADEVFFVKPTIWGEDFYLVGKSTAQHITKILEKLRAQNEHLRNQIHAMENSATWRLFEPYRQVRARMERE
jgi:hypothetical protein